MSIGYIQEVMISLVWFSFRPVGYILLQAGVLLNTGVILVQVSRGTGAQGSVSYNLKHVKFE